MAMILPFLICMMATIVVVMVLMMMMSGMIVLRYLVRARSRMYGCGDDDADGACR